MKFTGKLYQKDRLIDPGVSGDIQLYRRKPLTNIFDGSGHMETSRPLPVGTIDIGLDVLKGQFILAFDAPTCGIPEKIFINVIFVEEPERTRASFNLDYVI